MAATSNTSPTSAQKNSEQSPLLDSCSQMGVNSLGGDAKEIEGEKSAQREGYLIGIYCKKESWQPSHLSATESLTRDECTQLDNIICKLLDNGVLLDIKYTPISEILGHSYVPKVEAFSPPNHQGVYK